MSDDAALFHAWRQGDRAAGDELVARHYRGESNFRAFLFGIARNVLHEYFRSKARHGSPAIDFNQSSIADLAPGVATTALKRSEHRVLMASLRQLPIDLQLMLELYYWEEMGVEELAGEFKVPEGTIKSRLHRARCLLAELIPRVAATPEETERAREVLQQWSAGDE